VRLRCPFCGERDVSEYVTLGTAQPRCPEINETDASVQVFEAVYLRDNPAGPHEELWYHGFGCRSWLRVTRDTRTHEIFAVSFADAVGRS
jgi:sarcosine oxidase subunit delta